MKRKISGILIVTILISSSLFSIFGNQKVVSQEINENDSNRIDIKLNIEWEQVVNNGFGSRNNTIAWSMEEYNGYLYVGTRTDVKK